MQIANCLCKNVLRIKMSINLSQADYCETTTKNNRSLLQRPQKPLRVLLLFACATNLR